MPMSCIRRNASVDRRDQLAIDPGPRSITGKSVSGGKDHAFTGGKFKATEVPLGEIRTDEAGRLIVLGGTGQSGSPSNAPVYDPVDPDSFNNANDWYDDTSDAVMNEMIKEFGALGIVEARPGVKGDPEIPEVIYVESIASKQIGRRAAAASNMLRALERPPTHLEQAGWASEAQFHEFRRIRVRG